VVAQEKYRESLTGIARMPIWLSYVIGMCGFVAVLGITPVTLVLIYNSQFVLGVVALIAMAAVTAFALTVPRIVHERRRVTWLPFEKPQRIVDVVLTHTAHAIATVMDTIVVEIEFDNGQRWQMFDKEDEVGLGDLVTGEYLERDSLVRNLRVVPSEFS